MTYHKIPSIKIIEDKLKENKNKQIILDKIIQSMEKGESLI